MAENKPYKVQSAIKFNEIVKKLCKTSLITLYKPLIPPIIRNLGNSPITFVSFPYAYELEHEETPISRIGHTTLYGIGSLLIWTVGFWHKSSTDSG